MAKQRLFPEPPTPEPDRTPKERFSDLAGKVFSVPKSEIDQREKKWKVEKQRKTS